MAAPILRRLRRFAFVMLGSKAKSDDVLYAFLQFEGNARAIAAGSAVECFASFLRWLEAGGMTTPSTDLSPLHRALLAQSLRTRAALVLTVIEGFEPADAARILGCSASEVAARAAAAQRRIEAAIVPNSRRQSDGGI